MLFGFLVRFEYTGYKLLIPALGDIVGVLPCIYQYNITGTCMQLNFRNSMTERKKAAHKYPKVDSIF